MVEKRVLIVGTTADYIEEIRRRYPKRALFITHRDERAQACEPQPDADEELLSDLDDTDGVVAVLKAHLRRWQLEPSAVTCYDCESLDLAARLACEFDLPFPSQSSIASCRNKFLSKQIWHKAGVPCPHAAIVRSVSDVSKFCEQSPQGVILKPLTGSGSELVFKCSDLPECQEAFSTLRSRLATHPNVRMYRAPRNGNSKMNCRREFVIESFLEGQEYSCDFILAQRHLEIIRTAKKHIASDQPIGTTLAYAIPAALPPQLDQQNFKHQLFTAARSLGLKHAVCMVDFIVSRDVAFLLEMTPRPGGDCLPWMIRQSCGLDMLGLAMDFAEGIPVHIPDASRWKPVVGLRLLAETAGVIQHIDGSELKQSSSVRAFHLKVRPGSRIKLPPQDYDSRVLGHVIFQPDPSQSVQMQCSALRTKLKIEMRTDR